MNTQIHEVYQYHHLRHEELVQAAEQHRMAHEANATSRRSLIHAVLNRTGTLLTYIGSALIERYGDTAECPPAVQPGIEASR